MAVLVLVSSQIWWLRRRMRKLHQPRCSGSACPAEVLWSRKRHPTMLRVLAASITTSSSITTTCPPNFFSSPNLSIRWSKKLFHRKCRSANKFSLWLEWVWSKSRQRCQSRKLQQTAGVTHLRKAKIQAKVHILRPHLPAVISPMESYTHRPSIACSSSPMLKTIQYWARIVLARSLETAVQSQ